MANINPFFYILTKVKAYHNGEEPETSILRVSSDKGRCITEQTYQAESSGYADQAHWQGDVVRWEDDDQNALIILEIHKVSWLGQ